VRLLDEELEVVDRPVVGVDGEEVRDVVAAVAERRGVHRQQPDAVDAEPLQVVELVRESAEVARAVVVAVEEASDVDLVEDRGLEPVRLALEPMAGLRHRRKPRASRSGFLRGTRSFSESRRRCRWERYRAKPGAAEAGIARLHARWRTFMTWDLPGSSLT